MRAQNKQINKGIFFAFLTSIISGIAIFYSKLSLIKINPLILTSSRNFYVGLLFLLIFLFSKKKKEFKKLQTKEIVKLILIGVIGGGLPFYLFFTGLQFASPLTANLIHKTLFIWVSILGAIFLYERLNILYFLSYSFLIIAFFSFKKLELNFGKGELMILSATLLWSIENIIAKKVLKNVSSEIVGLFRMGIGSIILIFISLFSGRMGQFLSLDLSSILVIITGGSILFGYVFFWYKALKYAPVSLVAMILSFSVVIGNMLKEFFIGIKIPESSISSSILIGLSMSLILLYQFIGQKTKIGFYDKKKND